MQALLAGVFHGKIGGNKGKDALGIPHWNGARNHPDLTASRIKIGRRPDARVGGQWRRDPDLRLNVVGRHGKVLWAGLAPLTCCVNYPQNSPHGLLAFKSDCPGLEAEKR